MRIVAQHLMAVSVHLLELLRLVASIDGIDRLRFTTSHPIEFYDDIIDGIATRLSW